MADGTGRTTSSAQRVRLQMDRRAFVGAMLAVVVVATVVTLYLVLVSRTAAQGRRIQRLQAELSVIRRENEQLEVDVAREAAVASLLQRALDLGFVFPSPDDVEFLRWPGP